MSLHLPDEGKDSGSPALSQFPPRGHARSLAATPAIAKPQTAALVKFAAIAPVRVLIEVTKEGFVVGNPPTLKVGTPVTLVVTRTTDKTCATDIVLKEFGLSAPLR